MKEIKPTIARQFIALIEPPEHNTYHPKLIRLRRFQSLGWSDKLESFGPEIIENLEKLRSGRTAGF